MKSLRIKGFLGEEVRTVGMEAVIKHNKEWFLELKLIPDFRNQKNSPYVDRIKGENSTLR